eukprot:TRINITY_DN5396_c0_g1_i1.p1 TRINITY_DN5396_c0_g1~~TRINITY_DN5396_c0_g1_i1.p1  ORF type:complete len:400 (+),score=19.02 TRINITY_DN5396_c0_g1_i1:359-1558(+)
MDQHRKRKSETEHTTCSSTARSILRFAQVFGQCRKASSRQAFPKYLRPGALAQLRDAALSERAHCYEITHPLQKRTRLIERPTLRAAESTAGRDTLAQEERQPVQLSLSSFVTPINGQRKKHFAPRMLCEQHAVTVLQEQQRTEQTRAEGPAVESAAQEAPSHSADVRQEDGQSAETTLDCLPLEMLIRIVCFLRHSELRNCLTISKRMSEAVTYARTLHFNYTTPDRHGADISRHACEWPVKRIPYQCSVEAATTAAAFAEATGSRRMGIFPAAPRQAARPLDSRPSTAELRKIAAPLFQTSPRPQHRPASSLHGTTRSTRPPGLPRPQTPVQSDLHRALFQTSPRPQHRPASSLHGTTRSTRPPGLPRPQTPVQSDLHRALFLLDERGRGIEQHSLS